MWMWPWHWNKIENLVNMIWNVATWLCLYYNIELLTDVLLQTFHRNFLFWKVLQIIFSSYHNKSWSVLGIWTNANIEGHFASLTKDVLSGWQWSQGRDNWHWLSAWMSHPIPESCDHWGHQLVHPAVFTPEKDTPCRKSCINKTASDWFSNNILFAACNISQLL